MSKDKLIKDIDEEQWSKFTAICSLENKSISQKMNEVLDKVIQETDLFTKEVKNKGGNKNVI